MKKPAAKKPAAKKPAAKKPAAKKPTAPKKKDTPAKDPLPGNEEPTADEQKAADDAAKKEKRMADARARIARVMQALPVWYEATGNGAFWVKLGNRFFKMSPPDIKEHFRRAGLRETRNDEAFPDGVKEIDWIFSHVQDPRNMRVVDYSGALAGHRVGVYRSGGKAYLVTDEAAGVWDDLPAPAFPLLFGSFIQALLPDNQWRHFCYWLALSYLSLRNCDFKPGQCVFLVGKPKCGKSLCQLFVKLILGGRSGNPMDWMTEATTFNEDLIASEIWAAEDPRSSSDYKSREQFGDRLKEAANNDTLRAHAKFGSGIEVRIWRRVIFSLNLLPQHVQRIPPLIDGTEDKVNVYKCDDARATLARFVVRDDQQVLNNVGVPLPVGVQDRAALLRAIEAEIPLIRAWLLHEFHNVPDDLVDDRADIKAWQHPEIVRIINDLSREAHLMSLIDTYAWKKNEPDQPPIVGTAGEVYAELIGKAPNIATIVKSPIDMGRLLEAIKQQRRDGRVEDRVKPGNIRSWTIKPPPEITQKHTEGNPF